MGINNICKRNRLLLGLTVNEFATSIDVDCKKYKEFENGNYMFENDILKRIISSLYIEKEDFNDAQLKNEEDEYNVTNISLDVIEECEKGE